jgi:hypothetical protein
MDGNVDILPHDPAEWTFDRRYDIAVIPIGLSPKAHKFTHIPIGMFLTREAVDKEEVGIGDDIFMVGRFMDHDGGVTNRPATRFGNISVMPSPIEQPNGHMADSYCVDLHSRSGYSGSPVFMYRLPWQDLVADEIRMVPHNTTPPTFSMEKIFGLLGIHFAQFPEEWELRAGVAKSKRTKAEVPLITEGGYIRGLSGMTCVLPAWNIIEVLNLPDLVDHRERQDASEEERRRREGAPPEPESA